MRGERGQIALILVLAATVAGTLVISLAGRSTTSLRTQTLNSEKLKAFKAAESGVEKALLSGGSVNQILGENEVSYDASYLNEGSTGYVSDLVEPGDVISVLLSGASDTLASVRIYFSSESNLAAVKVSEYRVNELSSQYLINSFAFDGDSGRSLLNNFSDPVFSSGYNYLGTSFNNRAEVSVSPTALPTSRLMRILVLYSASRIGIEPVGGNLPGQLVSISSTGSYFISGADMTVKKKINLRKELEKVPVMFDSVLYSNSKLIQ